MELALWTYEGPPHVGAIRIAASMRDVHLVLHAPQGDTYADLLFTMIERENRRPPEPVCAGDSDRNGGLHSQRKLGRERDVLPVGARFISGQSLKAR